MKEARLVRENELSGIHGTFGGIWLPAGNRACFTAEPPWMGVRETHDESVPTCIREGSYTMAWDWTPRFGWGWRVNGVKNFTDVLLHVGNLPLVDTTACILPGLKMGSLNGQKAVLSSRLALNKLSQEFGTEPWMLTISTEDVWPEV